MLRVFLDSNILFSASHHTPNSFEPLWQLPDVEVVTSEYCVGEVRRNAKKEHQMRLLDALLERTTLVPDRTGSSSSQFMLPAKDQPVLQAAIACHADVLVTGDKNHFSRYFGQMIEGVLVEDTNRFRSRYPEVFRLHVDPSGRGR